MTNLLNCWGVVSTSKKQYEFSVNFVANMIDTMKTGYIEFKRLRIRIAEGCKLNAPLEQKNLSQINRDNAFVYLFIYDS